MLIHDPHILLVSAPMFLDNQQFACNNDSMTVVSHSCHLSVSMYVLIISSQFHWFMSMVYEYGSVLYFSYTTHDLLEQHCALYRNMMWNCRIWKLSMKKRKLTRLSCRQIWWSCEHFMTRNSPPLRDRWQIYHQLLQVCSRSSIIKKF